MQIRHSHVKLLDLMLAKGVISQTLLSAADESGAPPIVEAVRAGRVDSVKPLAWDLGPWTLDP